MDNEKYLQEKYNKIIKDMDDLKQEIEKQGYSIERGIISKIPDTLYYMELGFIGETQYESSGFYKTYREFILLDENILQEVLDITNIKDNNERELKATKFLIKILIDECDEENYSKYFNNFYNAMRDIHSGWLDSEKEIDYVNVYNEHHKNELLFEAYLKSQYENWHGYISFIISKKDLTKHNVNCEFSKYFRTNYTWREE